MYRWLWIVTLGLGPSAGVTGCASTDKGEEGEVKMSLEQCPAPVQETLKREAAGEKIERVDQENRDGAVVYETDVNINGQETEIVVAADGKVISKKTEDEEKKDHEHSRKDKD